MLYFVYDSIIIIIIAYLWQVTMLQRPKAFCPQQKSHSIRDSVISRCKFYHQSIRDATVIAYRPTDYENQLSHRSHYARVNIARFVSGDSRVFCFVFLVTCGKLSKLS